MANTCSSAQGVAQSTTETTSQSSTKPSAGATPDLNSNSTSSQQNAGKNSFVAAAAEVFASSLYPIPLAAAILGIKDRHVLKWIEIKKVRRHHIAGPKVTEKTPAVDIVEIYRFLAGGAANKLGNKPKLVAISAIRRHPDCQSRVAINSEHVDDYREHFEQGEHGMDPVLIIKVGEELWLVDGFTRLAAAVAEKRESIMAYVLPGTAETAIKTARRMNTFHGHRFTNQDMHAIMDKMMAEHPGLLTALREQTVPLRQIQKITGFSKSALSRLAIEMRLAFDLRMVQELLEKSELRDKEEVAKTTASQPMPKLADGDATITAAKKPQKDMEPPPVDTKVAQDNETILLLEVIRTYAAKIPGNPAEILISHYDDLGVLAGAILQLMNRHRNRKGMACLHDVRAVLKKNPLPKPPKA